MKRDAIFYQIFKRFPNLFFELIGQTPSQVQGYRFESVEVKEPRFRIDGVFLPPEDISPKIVFFAEVQFQKDPSLYHRFFSELFLYLYRNQTRFDDWYGVLIFPKRSLEPDDANLHRALLNSDQVQRLYLDELSTMNQRPLGISLVQLMVESEDRTIQSAKQLIKRAEQEATDTLSREDIIEVVTTIAVYRFARLSRQEVEAMLDLSLEETRVYQEAKAEGRLEGKAEGRLESKLEIAPMLLEMGLTVEQIAERLDLEVTVVQQVIDTSQSQKPEN